MGATSEIKWELLEQRSGRDIYAFQRRFPLGRRGENTTKRNVEYAGEREVVFYDDVQTISINPKGSEQRVTQRRDRLPVVLGHP